jgi:hypothetical protein
MDGKWARGRELVTFPWNGGASAVRRVIRCRFGLVAPAHEGPVVVALDFSWNQVKVGNSIPTPDTPPRTAQRLSHIKHDGTYPMHSFQESIPLSIRLFRAKTHGTFVSGCFASARRISVARPSSQDIHRSSRAQMSCPAKSI